MITLLVSSLSLAVTQPHNASARSHDTFKIAGLFGRKKPWVEIRQEIQSEYDYSPTVGRKPQPAADTPFKPVRYLTPEERDQPIIVEPAPRIVNIDEEAEKKKQAAGAAAADPNAAGNAYGSPAPAYTAPQPGDVPSYITSSSPGGQDRSRPQGWSPPGSATGSDAVPVYGQAPAPQPQAEARK